MSNSLVININNETTNATTATISNNVVSQPSQLSSAQDLTSVLNLSNVAQSVAVLNTISLETIDINDLPQ